MELHLTNKEHLKRINLITGQFLKGHTPHNKGKKWSEWMDGRKHNKVRRCLNHKTGSPNLAGQNKRKVIGIRDGKIIGVFESITNAANKLKIQRRNIGHCCEGKRKRKRCGGIYWFYESNYKEWNKLLI